MMHIQLDSYKEGLTLEAKTVQNVINELRTGHQIVISIPLACQLINNAVMELISLYATAAIPTPIDIEGAKANEPQALPNLGITKVMLENKPYRAYTCLLYTSPSPRD